MSLCSLSIACTRGQTSGGAGKEEKKRYKNKEKMDISSSLVPQLVLVFATVFVNSAPPAYPTFNFTMNTVPEYPKEGDCAGRCGSAPVKPTAIPQITNRSMCRRNNIIVKLLQTYHRDIPVWAQGITFHSSRLSRLGEGGPTFF